MRSARRRSPRGETFEDVEELAESDGSDLGVPIVLVDVENLDASVAEPLA